MKAYRAELTALLAAILTAGQSASPEPERLSANEALGMARDLLDGALESATSEEPTLEEGA